MPRNSDPNKISVGAGRAGQESVTSSALNINVTAGSGGVGSVKASEVQSETPAHLSGDNLQENLYSIDGLAPLPRPNRIGEARTDVPNPADSYEAPDLVEGFYDAAGVATAAVLTNDNTLEVSFLMYPSDRGILAVQKDTGSGWVTTQALNLEGIFTEGDPDDTAAPSRWVGQNDYVAGSSAAGNVDGLPQGIGLVDRLPALTSYNRGDFSFLAGGPDPVYEVYEYNYYAYQLARTTVEIDLGATTSEAKGQYRIVHFAAEADYFNAKNGLAHKTWGTISVGVNEVFLDSDTTTAIALSTANPQFITPVDTANSSEPTVRYLSGVVYYGPTDDFDVDWSATGLYDDSFLEKGVRLRWLAGRDEWAQEFIYTDYSGSGTAPGTTAAYNNGAHNISGAHISVADPDLHAEDGLGRSDTLTYTGNPLLLHEEDYGTTPVGFRLTSETFNDEETRYAGGVTGTVVPDGSTSSWDSTATLSGSDLLVSGATSGQNLDLIEGGVLSYPSINFSTAYPTGSPDYSNSTALWRAGLDKTYIRSFDTEASTREGKIRIVGEPTSGSNNLFEDMAHDTSTGLQVDILPGHEIPADAKWWSLGQTYGEGGALMDVEVESSNSILLSYYTDAFTSLHSGTSTYPLALRVMINGSTPSASEVRIYKIDWLPHF